MPAKHFGRSDLVPLVAEKLEISKVRAEATISAVLSSIRELVQKEAKKGEPVVLNIVNFGAFKVKPTAPRKGHNPKTGEDMEIPAGKRLSWTPSKTFKEGLF